MDPHIQDEVEEDDGQYESEDEEGDEPEDFSDDEQRIEQDQAQIIGMNRQDEDSSDQDEINEEDLIR